MIHGLRLRGSRGREAVEHQQQHGERGPESGKPPQSNRPTSNTHPPADTICHITPQPSHLIFIYLPPPLLITYLLTYLPVRWLPTRATGLPLTAESGVIRLWTKQKWADMVCLSILSDYRLISNHVRMSLPIPAPQPSATLYATGTALLVLLGIL
jgi:hypothetical protein